MLIFITWRNDSEDTGFKCFKDRSAAEEWITDMTQKGYTLFNSSKSTWLCKKQYMATEGIVITPTATAFTLNSN